jgi:uncharacterized protein GlcG (DUF336 family)
MGAVGGAEGTVDGAEGAADGAEEAQVPGLTLQQASTIVEIALKKARDTSCAPLAVAVLDDGGHLKAFAREDGAGIIRPQIAFGKAWGALGMGMGSRAFARRLTENPQQAPFFAALSAMSDGRVVPVPGGVLIRDASKAVVGAVGISGDVSDKDEACAVAGIEAAKLAADTGA